MSAIQFGLNVSTSAAPGADPVADARRAEDLGFDFVSASDHPHGQQPSYETWTMLSWIAAATTRLRVATRVLAVPYRSPAVLAKMAETFDRLSGGRLILGLGGGYSDEEFRAFGLGKPTPRDKVDGLEEAIRIIRGLWSEPALRFEGRRYHTDGARLEPKPEHSIPIWLGTYGNRALAVTGRLADGWIPSLGFAPPEQVTVMRDRVFEAARRAGRQTADITCAYNVVVRVDEHADARPSTVSGSPTAVIQQLRGFLDMGFTALNFMLDGPDTDEQAERLAKEVMPALRTGS
ncbi:MAG TPA: LLM class flavin-dependent oxidoreductase [Actinomycetota bacterium]|jgi:probable F420-dependent oxidoreductase|nr:LLM class flavin-dependent oxidoreductase [Actinomycetota bacterium]